jgi:hypothetical protein
MQGAALDERIAFWANPKRWPEDAMGHVFLGNAVDQVGKFLFPHEWDGSENMTPELYSLKISANGADFRLPEPMAKPWQKRLVHELVANRRPELGRDYTVCYSRTGGGIPNFSQDEWTAGLEEAEKIDAERKPKLKRREAVHRFIKSAILDGSLRFVLLPKRGGAFSPPQERTWWNVKDVDRIFYWCQLNPKDPTGIGVGGDDFQYVFVDEHDLNKLLTHASSEGVTAAQRDHSAGDKITPNEPQRADIASRGGVSSKRIRKTVEAAAAFFRRNGFLMWTKDEAEKELREILGATRIQCRSLFAEEGVQQHFPGEKGRRGTPNINRNKELEQFRHFFGSANMRN